MPICPAWLAPLLPGISLSFGVAGRHCHEPGQIHFFIVYPMDQFIKVAGTEGKVGGYFCRLPPLNENTDYKYSLSGKYNGQSCYMQNFKGMLESLCYMYLTIGSFLFVYTVLIYGHRRGKLLLLETYILTR